MMTITRFSLALQRVVTITLLIIFAAYVLFVLVPSYTSGIYNLSREQIWDSNYTVPLYSGLGSVRTSALMLFPVFVSIFAWYGIPVLTGVLAILLLLRYRMLRLNIVGWAGVLLIINIIVFATYPAADALLTWIVD
jgi:hypothetical protein